MTQAGPPAGWDPDAAAERIAEEAHAYREHRAWIEEVLAAGKPHPCQRCMQRLTT